MEQVAAPPPSAAPPARRIFYGWYIVGLAFLASLIGGGVGAYTLGVFMVPMQQDLGWSRTAISGVPAAYALINALLVPLVGGWLDRGGGKVLMAGGAFWLGAGLIATAFVQEVWQFYLVRSLLMGVGAVGMGAFVMEVVVSNWFVRKRGRAIAFGSVGLSTAAVILPPLCNVMIDAYGWRTAWVILGVVTWVVMIPATILLLRRRPEDMGLLPDGDLPGEADATATPATSAPTEAMRSRNVRWTRTQAMRTSALWLIIIATSLTLMANPAMLFHLVPFLQDAGFSGGQAAGGLSAIGLCGIICKPLWGLLLERIPVRYGAAAQMLISSSGIAAILLAASSGQLALTYLACFYFGIGIAGVVPVGGVLWANYFGRLTLGAVRSIGTPFTTAAVSSGALIGGVLFDQTGDYRIAFFIFMAGLATSACLILVTRVPTPPAETEEVASRVA